MSIYVSQVSELRRFVIRNLASTWGTPRLNTERVLALWYRRWPLWAVLAIFFLFGVVLHISFDSIIVHDVGTAFIIASLLGFSVDAYLKRDLAKDVFEGAVGYILPQKSKRPSTSCHG
jgi:hypothetical protein